MELLAIGLLLITMGLFLFALMPTIKDWNNEKTIKKYYKDKENV